MTASAAPDVTFVVPCYRLGHLLADCVRSILAQTYQSLEVLIMDDCSPDDTPAVARSFDDPRVQHVRNDPNLGHLRNYDKGIKLARGRYVWLISADDQLRSPHVLGRFVAEMDRRPGASFIFCGAVNFNDEGDAGIFNSHNLPERVFGRGEFLGELLNENIICAPAAMARKSCYDAIGGFPLDLPYAGDWYIWARFALDGEVIHLREPMVGYRLHATNMTKTFQGPQADALIRDELAVRWRIRRDARASGQAAAARMTERTLRDDYAFRSYRRVADNWPYGMTPEAAERSIREHCGGRLAARMRAGAFAAAGDACNDSGRHREARASYARSLRIAPTVRTAVKYALSLTGSAGARARVAITNLRDRQFSSI